MHLQPADDLSAGPHDQREKYFLKLKTILNNLLFENRSSPIACCEAAGQAPNEQAVIILTRVHVSCLRQGGTAKVLLLRHPFHQAGADFGSDHDMVIYA